MRRISSRLAAIAPPAAQAKARESAMPALPPHADASAQRSRFQYQSSDTNDVTMTSKLKIPVAKSGRNASN
ncbi:MULTISPECIES: hypothetical protein [Rhodopseudomonas]|uniref:hypothetical protein n=1 Tax=Rhodopseudomonas TaxID=1073 RepID=UPI00128B356C|nr:MULTISPECIES: hypothetical protein [Rhodopseudomonas]MDF3811057.1 hypothetical protein [Rhodopseudomonas sp. BAL398]WOK15953.1 hypothetical protein RBJ75_17475 [Rhodopseudomonas sp. BAL398]